MRSLAAVLSCVFLLALVQLGGALIHPFAALSCAVGIGAFSLVLSGLLGVRFRSWWFSVALVSAASLLGVLVCYVGDPERASWMLWLAPLAASTTAELLLLGQMVSSKRCHLCRRRIGPGGSFGCPRCGLRVCERCWSFQGYRCRLCEQNKVPIFGPDARWWEGQFGLPVKSGRCRLCLTPAAEAQLRACGRCGRAQCQGCWDHANGRCTSCGWLVADLPPQLRKLHAGLQ